MRLLKIHIIRFFVILCLVSFIGMIGMDVQFNRPTEIHKQAANDFNSEIASFHLEFENDFFYVEDTHGMVHDSGNERIYPADAGLYVESTISLIWQPPKTSC